MSHKPSSSSHRVKPIEGLNLTPFIDMVTCLMFFLLMFAGIIPVVIIDAPLPKIASTAEEVKQAQDSTNKLEITAYISTNGVRIKADGYGEKSFALGKNKDGIIDYSELHKHFVTLKQHRPNSKELTLMPNDDVPYELMIGVMDASRELDKSDAGYQALPPDVAGKPDAQQFNRLFPDVSIGGV